MFSFKILIFSFIFIQNLFLYFSLYLLKINYKNDILSLLIHLKIQYFIYYDNLHNLRDTYNIKTLFLHKQTKKYN